MYVQSSSFIHVLYSSLRVKLAILPFVFIDSLQDSSQICSSLSNDIAPLSNAVIMPLSSCG